MKDHQHVVFVGGQEENVAEQGRETELTAFFKYNAEEKERKGADFNQSDYPTYVDMPNTYVLKNKQWKVREKGFSIGRVHTVNPLAGDVFYLRMLLHHNHCRGKTSFEDLLEVDGEPFETYQAVCRHLGLLSDDQEWSTVLADAGGTQLCPQIRALYVIILLYCQPADPKKLFDDFWHEWTDDLERIQEQQGRTCTPEQLRTMVRLDIQVRLQSDGQDLPNFGLEPMTDKEKATVGSMVNVEEAVI